jgi:hypothetical protein
MKHECHATGCSAAVPPKMLMCRKHWFMVPRGVQAQVWATYRPGQEVTKDPSDEYMKAYRLAVISVELKEGRKPSFPEVAL